MRFDTTMALLLAAFTCACSFGKDDGTSGSSKNALSDKDSESVANGTAEADVAPTTDKGCAPSGKPGEPGSANGPFTCTKPPEDKAECGDGPGTAPAPGGGACVAAVLGDGTSCIGFDVIKEKAASFCGNGAITIDVGGDCPNGATIVKLACCDANAGVPGKEPPLPPK